MALQVLYPSNESGKAGALKAEYSLHIRFLGHADMLTSVLSVVAVHGLNGDPKNTWTSRKTHAFWLKDFLPQDVPDARVMTFGYNADAAFGNTTADIIDHAKGLLTSLVDKREEDDVGQRHFMGSGDAEMPLRKCGDQLYLLAIRWAEL
jgi:hypothetical protein